MKLLNTFNTKDYAHNTKGDYLTTMIDLFEVAAVANENLKTTGKLARNQRKVSDTHKRNIAKSLIEERRLYLWTIVIGISSKLIKKTKNGTKIKWPTTPDEIAKDSKYIELGEGQHRTLSLLADGMRELLGEFPVNVVVLVDPTEEEMMQRFCEINSRGKNMSRDLLFEFNSRLNELSKPKQRMDRILKAANDDDTVPFKFKIGEGSGLSIQTIVSRTVNDNACNVIETFEDEAIRIRGFKNQYRIVASYLRIINKHIGTKRINATRLGIALATLAPAVEFLRSQNMYCTEENLEIVYTKWLKNVLGSETLTDCDNTTCVYLTANGATVTVKDRWNGGQTVNTAIVQDHDLLIEACQNTLVRL